MIIDVQKWHMPDPEPICRCGHLRHQHTPHGNHCRVGLTQLPCNCLRYDPIEPKGGK